MVLSDACSFRLPSQLSAGGALLVLLMTSRLAEVTSLLSASQQQMFTDNGWTITEDGNDYKFQHTGLVDENTFTVGDFPGKGNPNTISSQNYNIYVPKNPAKSGSTSCTSAGIIGLAITGATFFNPQTSQKKNAVEGECSESFDDCEGHPNDRGVYHYHHRPTCVSVSVNEPIGIAMDGFLIYDQRDETGATLTSADLDTCGGRTGTSGDYRYHTQTTYPYILGCFSGSFSSRENVNTECHDLVTCNTGSLSAAIFILVVCLLVQYI